MATDVERLVVLLEANAENLRRQMRGAEGIVNNSTRRMERQLRSLQRAFYAVGAVLAGGGLLGQTVRLADAYRSLDNRLRLVTETEEERAELLRDLADLSAQTRTSLEGTTTVYFRLTRGLERFGVQGQRLIDIVRTINQTVAISGATATEAEGALIQFSQALNTDFQAAGQEIRSLQEQMPALVNAIEDGMGIARGSFVQMARDGEISTQQVIDALERVSSSVQAEFGETSSTAGQAMQAFRDSITIAVGQLNEGARATDRLAAALQNAAEAIRSNEDGWRLLGRVMGLIIQAAEVGGTAFQFPRFGGPGDQPLVGGLLGDLINRNSGGGGGTGPGFVNGQSNGTSVRLVPGFAAAVAPSVSPQMVDVEERALEIMRRQEEAQERLKDLAMQRLEIGQKYKDGLETIAEKEREAQEAMQRNIQQTVDGFLSAIENARDLEDALKRVVIQMIRMALMSEGGQSFLSNVFSSFASSLFGGGSLPGKAVGGPVSGGKAYMVGERGPELFVPRMGGSIVPNGKSAGSTAITFNVDARGAQAGVAEQIQAMFPSMIRTIKAEIRNDASRGGAFAGALGRA